MPSFAVVASLLLSKAAFGRHLYALGSSATVAEFSGVPTARTIILTYISSGLSAALAGMLLTGYSGQAYLGMGDSYLFTSIAAVADRNGVCRSLLYTWLRLVRDDKLQGISITPRSTSAFVPIRVEPQANEPVPEARADDHPP